MVKKKTKSHLQTQPQKERQDTTTNSTISLLIDAVAAIDSSNQEVITAADDGSILDISVVTSTSKSGARKSGASNTSFIASGAKKRLKASKSPSLSATLNKSQNNISAFVADSDASIMKETTGATAKKKTSSMMRSKIREHAKASTATSYAQFVRTATIKK